LKTQKISAELINPNTIIAKISVKYAKNEIQVKEIGDKYLSVSEKIIL
jgi:hypothetical protein